MNSLLFSENFFPKIRALSPALPALKTKNKEKKKSAETTIHKIPNTTKFSIQFSHTESPRRCPSP